MMAPAALIGVMAGGCLLIVAIVVVGLAMACGGERQ